MHLNSSSLSEPNNWGAGKTHSSHQLGTVTISLEKQILFYSIFLFYFVFYYFILFYFSFYIILNLILCFIFYFILSYFTLFYFPIIFFML